MDELEATKNLDGWEIIDDMSGHRWLGHVERRDDGFVYMDRCFIFYPLTSTAVATMQAIPSNPLDPRSKPQMGTSLTNVRSAAADVQLLFDAVIVPWRVKEAGGTPCSAFPGWYREMLLNSILGLEKDAREFAAKVRRSKMGPVAEESVSREKAR